MLKLRPFQRRFVAGVFSPGTRRAALSVARGNGKSWLAAWLVADSLTPGGRLFEAGAENILLSGSFDQARYVFRFARELLGTNSYSYTDSTNKIGIRHKATDTRLLVRSSRARGAFGIVGARIAIADEPGSWDSQGGSMMADALDTAIGKPGTDLRVVYIGTLAPSRSGWWHDLISDGSGGSTFVMSIKGNLKRWDRWPEIRRCNPLVEVSAEFRRTLLEERGKARRDPRLKARFCSYRLNVPSQDESSTLLTVSDWETVLKRAVPAAAGRPIVGIDLAQGRAWNAAVSLFKSGRCEAVALAPGVPSLSAQEKRDRVAPNTYQRLKDQGTLFVADGLRVPKVKQLIDLVRQKWGKPDLLIADRVRFPELLDCTNGLRAMPRVCRWSESAADIRALRAQACDGNLAVEVNSRGLLSASLAVTVIKSDDGGNFRLIKDHANCSRDDVSAALVLASGAAARSNSRKPGWRPGGVV